MQYGYFVRLLEWIFLNLGLLCVVPGWILCQIKVPQSTAPSALFVEVNEVGMWRAVTKHDSDVLNNICFVMNQVRETVFILHVSFSLRAVVCWASVALPWIWRQTGSFMYIGQSSDVFRALVVIEHPSTPVTFISRVLLSLHSLPILASTMMSHLLRHV